VCLAEIEIGHTQADKNKRNIASVLVVFTLFCFPSRFIFASITDVMAEGERELVQSSFLYKILLQQL
jgi:hypothetical protein